MSSDDEGHPIAPRVDVYNGDVRRSSPSQLSACSVRSDSDESEGDDSNESDESDEEGGEERDEEGGEDRDAYEFEDDVDADRFSLNTTTCDTLTSLHAASHSLLKAGYVDGRQMALLREQISRCHATLSRSKDYLSVFADRLNDLIEQMNATSTAMREKLKSENWPIPEVAGLEVETPDATRSMHAARSACAQALVELQQVQKLATEIGLSSCDSSATAMATCNEAAQLADVVSTVENEAHVTTGHSADEGSAHQGCERKEEILASQSSGDSRRNERSEDKWCDASQEDDNTSITTSPAVNDVTARIEGCNGDSHKGKRTSPLSQHERDSRDNANGNEEQKDTVPFEGRQASEATDANERSVNIAPSVDGMCEAICKITCLDGENGPCMDAIAKGTTLAKGPVSDDINTADTRDGLKPDSGEVHTFSYDVSDLLDDAGAGVACLVSASEDCLEKMQLQCDVIDAGAALYRAGAYEERVSNIVRLASKGDTLQFQTPIRVSVPYRPLSGSTGREREIVLKTLTADDPEWREADAADTTDCRYREVRFLECSVSSLDVVTFLVLARLRTDRKRLRLHAWKLTSSVDSRVSVVAPKACFRREGNFDLQVLPIDSAAVTDLRNRSDVCACLLSVSPMVFVRSDSDQRTPYTLTLPCQQSGARRPQSCVSDTSRMPTARRPASAWTASKTEHDESEETSHLLIKHADDQWVYKSCDDTTCDRESLLLPTNGNVRVIMSLRMRGPQCAATVVAIGTKLESFLAEREVALLVVQREDDLAAIHVACCNARQVETLRGALEAEGYVCGASPAPSAHVVDGQRMRIGLRGNLDFDDETPYCFVYHSRLRTAYKRAYIEEVDRFAQHGLDFYRGHVQLLMEVDNHTHATQLLCEVAVMIPKPPAKTTVIIRAPIHMQQQGSLTLGYFRELSHFLGDDWQLLAARLGVSRARLQSLIRMNVRTSPQSQIICRQKNIESMLVHWYKICPKSHDKVNDLRHALDSIGREDLADELETTHSEFLAASKIKAEEERMRRAMQIVTHNSVTLRHWEKIARDLGLAERDIALIAQESGPSRHRQCLVALRRWREVMGDKAGHKQLWRSLKRLKFKEAADQVSYVQ